MKNLKLFLFFTCLYFVGNPSAFAQPEWVNFTTIDSPKNLQFQDNYVWYGGRGGLVRIDRTTNESFIFHTANSNLPANDIEDFAVAPDGILWVLSREKLGKFINGEFIQVNNLLNGSIELRFFNKIYFSHDGNVIIHATAGTYPDYTGHVVLIDNVGNISELYNSNGNLPGVISSIGFIYDEDDNLWAGGHTNGLVKINGSDITIYNSDNSPFPAEGTTRKILQAPDGRITSIHQDDSGQGIISAHFFDGINWESHDFISISLNPNSFVKHSFFDADGNLWIVINKSGMIRFDGNNYELLPYPDIETDYENTPPSLMGISEDNHWWIQQHSTNAAALYEYDQNSLYQHITSNANFNSTSSEDLYVDGNNNIWYVNSGGFSKYNGTDWENMGSQHPEMHSFHSIVTNENNEIWISGGQETASPQYALAHFDGTEWEYFYDEIGVEHSTGLRAKDLQFDSQGNLWAAVNGVVVKYDGFDWDIYDGTLTSWSNTNTLEEIIITPEDKIFVSSWRGLFEFDGTTFQEIPLPYVDPTWKIISWIFADQDGNIWVSHEDRISIYDGINVIDFTQSIPSNITYFSDMTQDKNGVYWFGASGKGLARYDGNSWVILNEGINQSNIRTMTVDSFNNIWIGMSTGGIAVFNENGINQIGTNFQACMEGTVFFDFNENGEIDNGEFNLPNQKLLTLPDSTIRFSSVIGKYQYGVLPNSTNSVQILPDENDWLLTSDSVSYTVEVEEGCVENLDFGLNSTATEILGEINITPGLPRCFLPSAFWGNVKNVGFVPFSGSYSLEIDEQVSVLNVNPEPDDIDGQIYTWDLETLNPYQIRNFQLEIQYPGVDAIGDTIVFVGQLRDDMDNLLDENIEKQVILCSYDPNDKAGESTGESIGNFSLLGDALEYLIRFENSGNDTAFRVVIKDTLSQFLDINTFEMVGSSHPVEVSIQHREVSFIFNPILLPYSDIDPVGSQGYVKFKIKPVSQITDNQIISNTAFIYFDFNPAIVTNTTENILVEELPLTNVIDNRKSPQNCQLNWSPNPFATTTRLAIPDEFLNGTFTLIDPFGKQVLQNRITQSDFVLKRENLAAGIYFYQLQGQGNQCSGKLVVH